MSQLIKEIPSVHDFTGIYFYVNQHTIDQSYVKYLDELIDLKDEVKSSWLNVTTKTYRSYKQKDVKLKDNTKEHIVLLLSLYRHGLEVFDSKEHFEKWLLTRNFLLDNQAPMDFLDTVSGIQLIDNRLTALEFGENA